MTYVFAALAAALVVIYMARPNFRRAVMSAALFFRDDPVLGSTSRIAWSTPRPTPLFYLQLSVVLLLLLAVPHCRGAAVMDRSVRTGVRVLVDRSASMSTQQNGATRFDAAIAALRSATAPQQSAIACFTLSAFDLELIDDCRERARAPASSWISCPGCSRVRSARSCRSSSARSRTAPSRVEPRAPLSTVTSAKVEGGCATAATIVVSDMPAPPWMDGPASRGDVWIDVSQPAPNAGIVDLVDDRDRVSGKVQRVRVVVGRFGGMATSNLTLSVRSPDGAVRARPIEAWDGPTGSVDVIPSLPGRYTFQVNPGGAYRYDDDAAIDVPPSGPVRVDWRVARREWLTRLGWTEDRDNPDLRVLPSIEMLDSRPAIVLGSGYAPRTRPAQPVTTFLETSPLVSGLNLDVAERSGMNGAPSLPPGFSPVLTGPESAVWIAERAAPAAAFVPGLPLDGDDNVARFSSTVFLNAARWILERRPRPRALHADLAGTAGAVGEPHRPPSRGGEYRAHAAIRRHVRSARAARAPDRAAPRAVAVAGRGRSARLPHRARPRAAARRGMTFTFAPEYGWQLWLAALVVAVAGRVACRGDVAARAASSRRRARDADRRDLGDGARGGLPRDRALSAHARAPRRSRQLSCRRAPRRLRQHGARPGRSRAGAGRPRARGFARRRLQPTPIPLRRCSPSARTSSPSGRPVRSQNSRIDSTRSARARSPWGQAPTSRAGWSARATRSSAPAAGARWSSSATATKPTATASRPQRQLAARGIAVHVLPIAAGAPALGILSANLPAYVDAGSETYVRGVLGNAAGVKQAATLALSAHAVANRRPNGDAREARRTIEVAGREWAQFRTPVVFAQPGLQFVDVAVNCPAAPAVYPRRASAASAGDWRHAVDRRVSGQARSRRCGRSRRRSRRPSRSKSSTPS